MRFLLFFSFIISFATKSVAQDTLSLAPTQVEELFFKNNLRLIAEKFNISAKEAEILAVKVWPNPSLSIEEVNLWQPRNIQSQEIIPPLFGNFGKNTQFSIELEQMIVTAGKRKKTIQLKQLEEQQAKALFEQVLQALLLQTRTYATELFYNQHFISIFHEQLARLQQLTNSFQKQVENGFMDKGEFIRLKATELDVLKELKERELEQEMLVNELNLLLNLPSNTVLKIENKENINSKIRAVNYDDLLQIAQENKPDFTILSFQEEVYAAELKIQKAERIPDLNLVSSYNRGDGIYPNYLGFGLRFDLPIFDLNKGNIQKAKINIEREKIIQENTKKEIEKEIFLAYSAYSKALEFIQEIDENYESELDKTMTAYHQNFLNKNIDIIHYLDFMSAFFENKQILSEAKKNVEITAFELNYVVGKDIIK